MFKHIFKDIYKYSNTRRLCSDKCLLGVALKCGDCAYPEPIYTEPRDK